VPASDPRDRGEGEDVPPWDVRIFEKIDAGVDASLIEANLARSPTERLHRLQDRIRFLENLRR
jgi:hypothetical protein